MQKRRRDINEALDVSLYNPARLWAQSITFVKSKEWNKIKHNGMEWNKMIRNSAAPHRTISFITTTTITTRESTQSHTEPRNTMCKCVYWCGKTYGMRSHHGSILTRIFDFIQARTPHTHTHVLALHYCVNKISIRHLWTVYCTAMCMCVSGVQMMHVIRSPKSCF